MPDQRETLVRKMIEEGTSDDDIRATLKAFDVSPLRKPAAAEDYMRPEDIANRDNGTPLALDVLKGFGKRAVSSVAGLADLAHTALVPGAHRSAPFNPVLRRVEEAMAPANNAQELGGNLELAAELAGPAVSAAKALPAVARGAVGLAKSALEPVARGLASETPLLTQARQAVAKKVLAKVLDFGTTSPNAGGRVVPGQGAASLQDDVAGWLDDLRAPEPPPSVELPPPAALPPGYVPRAEVPPVSPAAAPVAPQGRLVPAAVRPPVEDEIAAALAETRAPVAPVRVTTPPPVELPPGYTPRSTVPAPVKARMAKAAPKAEKPPTEQPARRAYFLKSPDEMLAARVPSEPVAPSGSITLDDLPEAWKSRTGQDLFPTTGVEAKEITAAFRQEIKERGMTIGQAIAAVSKNRNIPTAMRHQITRALQGGTQ